MKKYWSLVLLFICTTLPAQPRRIYREGKVTYISKTGDTSRLYYDAGSEFLNDFALVVHQGKRFFLNTSLQKAFDLEFEEASPFQEGYACVRSNGLFGYLGTNGQWVIQPQFEQAASFSGGVAKVKLHGSWYLINKQGKKITNEGFDQIADWNEFPIAVCVNQQWGYINAAGSWVIAPKFRQAYPFQNKRALVQQGIKQFLINRRGKIKKEIEEEDDDELKKEPEAIKFQ